MGDVTVLAQIRARRLREAHSRPRGSHGSGTVRFYFDPCCPFSYLAAERIERRFSGVDWIPVAASALQTDDPWSDPRAARLLRALAERRAAELKLPLVWPEPFPPTGTTALRVAVYAARVGKAPAFALAASRLAFCGGFDLEEPANLVEAAAAAGIGFEACLRAAAAESIDGLLVARARSLLTAGMTQLPALRIGARWFAGESSLAAASAWRQRTPMAAGLPR